MERSEKNINDDSSLGLNRACVCRQGLLFVCSLTHLVARSIYLFYMFCSCWQLFFTRCACVFKSQWFQLYYWWLFSTLSLGRLSREDMEKWLFIPLSTLSCCESREPVIKIHLFIFLLSLALCAFSGNNACFCAIYSSCVSGRSCVVCTESEKIRWNLFGHSSSGTWSYAHFVRMKCLFVWAFFPYFCLLIDDDDDDSQQWPVAETTNNSNNTG